MRILYLPMYDKPKLLENSSTFNWAVTFFGVILNMYKDVFLYMGVPEESEDLPVFFDHPRVMAVLMPASGWQYQEMGNVSVKVLDLFKQSIGKYLIDVVFNDKVLSNAMVTAYLNDSYKNTPQIMVGCPIQYSLSSKYIPLPPSFFMAQAIGLATADFTIWSIDHQVSRTLRENRKYLSPTALMHIQENSFRGLFAYNYEEVDTIYKSIEKSRVKIKLNYANGASVGYKIEDIFDVYDFLFCLGEPVEISATVPDSEFPTTLSHLNEKYEHFNIHFGLNREEFYKEAASCHVGLYLGMDGELSDSIMEQTLLGQVMEVRKEETAIRNLSMILNKLFAEYGETVSKSYMFFTYGTKLHLMVSMSRSLQKSIDGITRYCEDTNRDISEVLEKIVKFGTNVYKGDIEIRDIAESDNSTSLPSGSAEIPIEESTEHKLPDNSTNDELETI